MTQPRAVMETMRDSSLRATCLGRPARGFGTMVPPAGDSIWCGALVRLSLELAIQARQFK